MRGGAVTSPADVSLSLIVPMAYKDPHCTSVYIRTYVCAVLNFHSSLHKVSISNND